MSKLGDDIFEELTKEKKRDKTDIKVSDKEIRKTFMVRESLSDLIDRQAYHELRQKKDVLNEILEEYFKDKNIKPWPKGRA